MLKYNGTINRNKNITKYLIGISQAAPCLLIPTQIF